MVSNSLFREELIGMLARAYARSTARSLCIGMAWRLPLLRFQHACCPCSLHLRCAPVWPLQDECRPARTRVARLLGHHHAYSLRGSWHGFRRVASDALGQTLLTSCLYAGVCGSLAQGAAAFRLVAGLARARRGACLELDSRPVVPCKCVQCPARRQHACIRPSRKVACSPALSPSSRNLPAICPSPCHAVPMHRSSRAVDPLRRCSHAWIDHAAAHLDVEGDTLMRGEQSFLRRC